MRTHWNIEGYPGYHRIRPNLENFIKNNIKPEIVQNQLLIAINEAVCNAVRYGKSGPESTRINITLSVNKLLDKNLFTLSIKSDTKKFDISKQYKKMAKDALKKEYWYENTQNDISGRGLWMMLIGVDLLTYSSDSNEVVLLKVIPTHNCNYVEKTARELLTRFVV